MTGKAQSGHPGGSLSAADILSVLYFHEMNIKPEDPAWPERDRFVLSKGHAAPALYATLAERGFFPVEELTTLRQLGGRLEGHPDMRKAPGVEISSGSLGQGLAVANGMALALRLDKLPSRVYCLIGDGESQEGEVWEAAMFGGFHKLSTVTAIVDYNNLQIDGFVSDVLDISPLKEKWEAFGWQAIEVDGHDVESLMDGFSKARAEEKRPSVLIAKTIKCKGISFMENKAEYHGKAPTPEQVDQALEELCGVEVIDDKPGDDT